MTLTLPSAARPAAAFIALAWTGLTFGATLAPTPAQAAEGAFYRAELTSAPAKPRPLAGGLVWSCHDTSCSATRGTSRPAIVCARLAKEVGPVTAFVADGKPLEAEALARCNGN